MIQTIMLRCKCGSRIVWRGDKDYWSHEKQRYVGLDDPAHIVNAWIKRHEECMRDPKRPYVKCAREVVNDGVFPSAIEAVKSAPGECWVRFTGRGGYPGERESALGKFVVGCFYRVIGGSMGQSRTTIRLNGVDGEWNSCLFEGDLSTAPIENPYKHK